MTFRDLLSAPPVVGGSLILFSLALHLSPLCVTTLNLSNNSWNPEGHLVANDYVEYVLQVHTELEPAFAKRPLTTWVVQAFIAVGLPTAWAFIVPSFLLIFFAGLLVRRLALRMGMGKSAALGAQVAFHLLPTVLFAFGIPFYSYDEPLQYVFMLLTLQAFHERRHVQVVLWFALATISRETSILLLPSLVWIRLVESRGDKLLLRIAGLAWMAIPVLTYLVFLFVFVRYAGIGGALERDTINRSIFLDLNFGNGELIGETICYAFFVLGLPTFLMIRYWRSQDRKVQQSAWTQAFIIALVLNTVIVLIATKAREARLFTLPLLLVLPHMGKAWIVELQRHGGGFGILRFLRSVPYTLAFVILCWAVYQLADDVFILSEGLREENLYHEYFILQTTFIFACLLADAERRRGNKGLSWKLG